MQSPPKRILEWFECLPPNFQQQLALLMAATLPQAGTADRCDREQAVAAIHQWLSRNVGQPPQEIGNALAFQAVVRFLTSSRLTKNGAPENSILLGRDQIGSSLAGADMEAVDAMLASARETQKMWLVIAASWRALELSCLTTSKIEHWLLSQDRSA
jgi:hypothetical protein